MEYLEGKNPNDSINYLSMFIEPPAVANERF